jgi:chromosome segregation ATPase
VLKPGEGRPLRSAPRGTAAEPAWHSQLRGRRGAGAREAIRQLAALRRRLTTAEDALAEARAALKRAETAYDAANDSFTEAERVLDAAREQRARAREAGYAARQAHERAAIAAARLQRRVTALSAHLDEMGGPGRWRVTECVF